MTRRDKLLAYAQLLRLPNVFTAFADIALGACAASVTSGPIDGKVAYLVWASGLLYVGGMALNDWFDRSNDARSRPSRPIPSGRVPADHAAWIGFIALLFGVSDACLARETRTWVWSEPLTSLLSSPPGIAFLIAAAVLLYDGYLKRTPLGPVGMGLCRFLNVLLGLSAGGGDLWTPLNLHLAGVVGLYIVGVTWFARTEEGESQRSHLLAAAGVMLAALAVALALPTHFEPGTVFIGYPYLLVAFGFVIGLPVVAAIREPSPKRVQAAVKACVLGLVLLDAVLATAFVGPAGLLIALLLIPARYLGRWVYST